MAPFNILAADIGGTNSRFGHFEARGEGEGGEGGEGGEISLIGTSWVETKGSGSFGHLLELLKGGGFSLSPKDADVVVVAVAGPVERGSYSSPPFIEWDIELSNARDDFGFRRSVLINDFVAQAYACRSEPALTARSILPGELQADPSSLTLAVMGAGTALGKAALVPDCDGGYAAVPSEGGHAGFPFAGPAEAEYQAFLSKRLGGYVTANDVVSGAGLSSLHEFLSGDTLSPKEVAEGFEPGSETLRWASRFFGRACRDFALETLALGGLFVAGGVAARAPELLTHEAFEAEFLNSRTMGAILKKVPISLFTDEQSGLWGAAVLGRQMLLKGT